MSKKDFDTDDDDVSTSSFEESQASTNSEFQCSDSNLESDLCSEDTSGSITEPSQSESDTETCYEESHSNFSEALQDFENELSVSEPESLCRENNIIFCG